LTNAVVPPAAKRRLEEVCARFELGNDQRGQFERLLAALAEDEFAPTTVRDPLRAVDVHIADSLSALGLPAVQRAEAVADLGSGAGLPGLPLAIALPAASVALVESVARKAAFIEHAREAAGVANARVITARVEAWREGQGKHDLVTARALAPLPIVCEYAAPLMREGGTLVVWKGRRDQREEEAATRAAAELGLEPTGPVRSAPYAGSRSHHLHRYVKVSATPSRFPRRVGTARKAPLGGSS
jgi:16S rRNA (guanine527-N7)-methyltransferase